MCFHHRAIQTIADFRLFLNLNIDRGENSFDKYVCSVRCNGFSTQCFNESETKSFKKSYF